MSAKELELKKVCGDANPADRMTKSLVEARVLKLCEALDVESRSGRAQSGLKVREGKTNFEVAIAL